MDGQVFKDSMYLSWINPGEWHKYIQKHEKMLVGSGVY